MTALEVIGVRFAYGARAVLDGVSFGVRAGERVALLGRNGAGKTTLTKIIVALLHPSHGDVVVEGRSTRNRAPEDVAGDAAYVFQHPDQQLFARTLLDEVAFGPRMRAAPRALAEESARHALARVGLAREIHAHPYDLPLWGRKLVTLAAAVALEPRLLVLDEPTQGFDRARVALVGELLTELAAGGVSVLAVTHDLTFAAETLERAIVLEGGRVAFDGSLETLLFDPARLEAAGLRQPPSVALAAALGLDGRPRTVAETAARLAARLAAR